MKLRPLTLCLLTLLLTGCALGSRVEFEDSRVFATPPQLVQKGESFFLRCERSGPEGARPESIRCEVEGEHLLVFVPILVSAERERRVHPERGRGLVYDYPLTMPSGLRNLDDLEGRVFWLDPDGTQHALDVISTTEAGVLPASSRGR